SPLSPPSHSTLLFFFQSHRPHRPLPSFPTRRSSDLTSGISHPSLLAPAPQPRRQRNDASPPHQEFDPALLHPAFDLIGLQVKLRSEEHTSELQSLTNLVCRLLLEKKKNKHKIANRHH